MATVVTDLRIGQQRLRGAAIALALVVLVAAGLVLRLHAIAHPHGRLSADEHSYLRLAADLYAGQGYGDAGVAHPFHWAPGTPVVFAVAHKLDHGRRNGLPLGPLRAQALIGAATIVAVFGLAAMLAGAIAGLVAAAAISLYPPAIDTSSFLVSEPLGGLTLTLAALALVWAWQRGSPWRWGLAGAALGFACLARADVLLPAALVVVLAGVLRARRDGARPAAVPLGLLALGLVLVVAPWTIYASTHAGHLVPVTDGAVSTLVVGTYLPGNGTIFGVKREIAPEARRLDPHLRHTPARRITSTQILDALAARHPGLGRDAALRAELRDEVRRYVLGRPFAYLGLEARKLWRMWGGYYHGVHTVRSSVLWWHRLLALAALAGLVAGIVRARRPELAVLLVLLLAATAIDVLFVAEPRHNIRLMPVLVAAGAAGAAIALRRRPVVART